MRLHDSGIGRRYEQLCRVQINSLSHLATRAGEKWRLDGKASRPPKLGGVYAFWWTGSLKKLARAKLEIVLKGPGGRDVPIAFSRDWLGLEAGGPVPLYVGKTADNIRQRIGLHLLLGTGSKAVRAGRSKAKAPTTSCQLRAGVERLFPDVQSPVPFILENIGLSYVELHGDAEAATRFYLEDLAIGLMRPILNVDVER